MKFNKTFLIILSFFVQMYLVTSAHADPTWINKKAEAQEMFLSVSLPEKDRLTLVSFVRISPQESSWAGSLLMMMP